MRGSRPRKPAANAFLNAAKKQIEATKAEAEAETAAEAAAAAYVKRQSAFFERHVTPIVDSLLALPSKDGRAFKAESRVSFNKVALSLTYTGGETFRGRGRPQATLSDAVSVILQWYKADDDFSASIIRYDQHETGTRGRNRNIDVNTVEDLQAELGKWVASVAPDRLGELEAPRAPKASGRKPRR